MLNLNYYFVDVDENSCLIAQMQLDFDIRDFMLARNKSLLTFSKEYITRCFKAKVPFGKDDEFKVVFVNKQDKLYVKAQVTDSKTHKLSISPTASTENYEIFFVNPGQSLSISCQVVERETEIRHLGYVDIESNCKDLFLKMRVK